MGSRRKPAVVLSAGLAAIAMAGGGFLAIDQANEPAQPGIDAIDTAECQEQIAQAADEQAERIEEMGANAPNFDFNFPEDCLK